MSCRTTKLTHSRDSAATIRKGLSEIKPQEAARFRWQFDLAFVAMAGANIFYTCFAHDRLTRMRRRRNKLRKDIGLSVDDPVNASWIRGFWSHLLPFFIATLAVAAFGCYLLRVGP